MLDTIFNKEDFCRARELAGSYLVLTGDCGFEAYLSVPFRLVVAELLNISTLMLDLESLERCNTLFPDDVSQVLFAGYESGIEYGVFLPGDKVAEYGEITDSLWLSPLFDKFNIKHQVWDIISGQASRLRMNSTLC